MLRNWRLQYVVFLCAALGIGHTFAFDNAHLQETRFEAQRDMYRKAMVLLESGRVSAFKQQADKLRDYPLYPYLEYYFILRYISSVPDEEIRSFMTEFRDTPLADRLDYHWKKSMVRRKQWGEFLSHYQPGESSTTLDCYYYWAQLKQGNKDEAFAGAARLWNVGKSQVKACDPLFNVWRKSDAFTADIAWERTKKAMANRKLQLTRYLERYLTDEHRKITQEWRRTYRNPNRLKSPQRYTAYGDDMKPVVISGFKRLIRKDYQLAGQLWPDYENQFNFTGEEKAELFNYFARNTAVNYYPEAEAWLDKALLYPGQQELVDYGIRHALRSYDWQRVKHWIAMLSPAERGSGQWRYWEAKAEQVIEEYQSPLLQDSGFHVGDTGLPGALLDDFDVLNIHRDFINALSHSDYFFELLPNYSLSLLDNGMTPRELMESLTGERSFYGFIASEQVRRPLSLNNRQSQITEEQLATILQHPGIVRARELYLLQENTSAHREWYHAIQTMSSDERGAAAHVAHLWGWHFQAIIAAARSNIRDNLELRFPKAYYESVSNYAQSRGLASDWVYSLIRQESAFFPHAKSGVGALGIMQIMPSTARQVSRQSGIQLKNTYQLLDPNQNIEIGTAYLDQLLNRFNGNLVLATTAYNAGPHRAARWQPENQPMDGDIWIETIPIHETRSYVKNIFTYQAIYRHNLGLEARLSDSLKVIQPKQDTSIATN